LYSRYIFLGRAENAERIGEKMNAYSILVGQPEGKSPVGRPRRRWEDNNKMYLREIEWGGMGCIDLAR
jgi:hypothetical protein